MPEYYHKGFHYEHNFQIDPRMQQMTTIRLSFWTALSDLGGFYDGLYVLIRFFVMPIAASFFQAELVKGIRVRSTDGFESTQERNKQ